MASCSSTQGAKLPRPGPGLLGTRDGQGSPDPTCSCLHGSARWQGDCMPSALPLVSRLTPPEARTEKPEAKQIPAPRRTCGSQEPATHSALSWLSAGPAAGPAPPHCHRRAGSPARHPTCLTCLTSSSLHPPGPQVPRLPFLFSASASSLQHRHLPEPSAPGPHPAWKSLHPQ